MTMTRLYEEWMPEVDLGATTLATELHLEYHDEETGLRFLCTIDLLQRDGLRGDRLVIGDHKSTGSALEPWQPLIASDPQMGQYGLAVRELFPDEQIHSGHHRYMKRIKQLGGRAKPPHYRRSENIPLDDKTLAAHARRLLHFRQEMTESYVALTEGPSALYDDPRLSANPNGSCKRYCPHYGKTCHEIDTNPYYEEMIDDFFELK